MKLSVIVSSLLVSVFLPVFANDFSQDRGAETVGESLIVETAIVERKLNAESAAVKSRAQYEQYLLSSGASYPIFLLPTAVRQQFEASMTFNQNGLTGFDYKSLEGYLSPSEIYSVLTPFGAQHLVPMFKGAVVKSPADRLLLEKPSLSPSTLRAKSLWNDDLFPNPNLGPDYDGYACTSTATCTRNSGSICMSRC
jgi:hypothetical protein